MNPCEVEQHWTKFNIEAWLVSCLYLFYCFLGFLSVIFIFAPSSVILCLWSLWVEGTCSKRSVAQIEACAAKAEREWKEWEKETEIPKNEKTYRKNVYKYDTRQNKATWKFEMMTDSGNCLFQQKLRNWERREAKMRCPMDVQSRRCQKLHLNALYQGACGAFAAVDWKMKWKIIWKPSSQYFYATSHHILFIMSCRMPLK